MRRRQGAAGLVLVLLAGCAPETVLSARIDGGLPGKQASASPAAAVVSVDEGSGTVRVIAPPPGGSTPWTPVKPPSRPNPWTATLCNVSQFRGDGTYTLTAALLVPHDAGVATLQFQPFAPGAGSPRDFLHLDFLPSNTVRVDDKNSATFGTFPRDQVFVVVVTLNVTASSTKAHFGLLGAGASGSLDYTVDPSVQKVARQFGAVRFGMTFRHASASQGDAPGTRGT